MFVSKPCEPCGQDVLAAAGGPAPVPHCSSQEAGNSSLFWKVPIVMPDATGPGVKLRRGTADSCNTLVPASVCPGAAPRLELFPEVQLPLRAPGPSCPIASLVLSIDSVWRLQPSGLDFVSRETSCESHTRLSSSPAAQRSITCGQEKGSRTAFSRPVALAGQQAPPRAAASVWADGRPEQAWSKLRAP